ncbi:MFS transporter [Methanocorpusculum sp. MG]|uniref:MFS transporter n=1 Tax=Methanocorpusculum petauri TaxID=3002863 RepID=A0ABT4IGN3_9EURY|nr:MFS transporter [Methanocorpusculum petauri]MCZ0860906.1 MFS transporter [Methanocorpusculum petauri]MDE2442777.1 MFS transporter [Methanocorpusculum sp.]
MDSVHLNRQQYLVAITVAIACFLPPFIGEATNIALPSLISDLQLPMSMFGWILTIYLLTSTVFLIPAARYADKISKKVFFSIGVLLLGVGSLGIGLATTGEMVLVMRAIEGVGNALMFGTAIALVTSVVKVELRGTAIGIAMTGVFLGQLAGPLLAGTLTDVYGWQMVYLILVPIALLSFILTVPFVPRDAPTDKMPYDWPGAVLFILGMTLGLYGFSKMPDLFALGLLIAGLVLLGVFFRYERRASNPLIPVQLILKNRGFTFNNSANLLYYVAIYAMGSLVSMYMTHAWGFSALERALVVTTQGLILVLFTIVAGKFYDHLLPRWLILSGAVMAVAGGTAAFLLGVPSADPAWLLAAVIAASVAAFGCGSIVLAALDRLVKNAPPKYATTIGLFIIALGMMLLLTCGAEQAVWTMIAVQALFGVGIAIFVTPNSTAIMNAVTEQEYGMASGTLSTTRMLGMAVSIGVMTVLTNLFLGAGVQMGSDHIGEFLVMMHATVLAAIVVLVFGMILSWTADPQSQ